MSIKVISPTAADNNWYLEIAQGGLGGYYSYPNRPTKEEIDRLQIWFTTATCGDVFPKNEQ